MRHDQLKHGDAFDVVEIATNEGPSAEALAFANLGSGSQPEAAVPDVPGVVGVLIAISYLLIVGVLAFTIANAGKGPFMIAIDLMFLAAFFTVPVIFLKLEGDPTRRPSMGRFMAQGMQTYTGHVSGGGALTQMLVVPVLLAMGVLCIGIIVMVP